MSNKPPIDMHGHRANKRAGQNFLISEKTADSYVALLEANGVSPEDTVIEIGPGLGALTKLLCRRYKKVIAIEKDKRLHKIWQKSLIVDDNLELILADASNYDYAHLAKALGSRLNIISNLPFNVSTVILQRLFQEWQHVDYVLLTFQKEVAERLVASPSTKAYGALTIFRQLFCDADLLLELPANEFYPVPKIDSQVVGMRFLSEPRAPIEQISGFQKFVHKLFLARRKTLLNGLKMSGKFATGVRVAEAFLEEQQLTKTVRAEALDYQQLLSLYQICLKECP